MRKLFTLWLTMMVASLSMAQIIEPVHWSVTHQQEGKTLWVKWHAKIDNSYHLYAMDVPEDGPQRTEFHYDKLSGLEAVGTPQVSEGQVIKTYDKSFDMELAYFEKQVTFAQQFKIVKNDWNLTGYVYFMSCNDEMCTAPTNWDFSLQGTATASAKAETKATAKTLNNESQPVGNQPAATAAVAETEVQAPVAEPTSQTTSDLWASVIEELSAFGEGDGDLSGRSHSGWYIFLAGFLAGLVALVTPCVWPMIPMTVSFFLKRTKDRRQSLREAYTYGISIIVIYLLLGLAVTAIFGASALNSLATNAIFNILFFLLLVVFAFSFLGAFELTLPSSWTTRLDQKADTTTGLLSIFFMAFTLCLVSFSCTGPIIGTLLVETATSGSMLYPAIGMTGFALALSLPFTLFAMFPQLLKSMPKSGGWLNRVKVVLGFCELALSLKFLSVADLAYGWGILDREVFLCLWIVIFLLMGLYLLGFIRLPHDDDPQPEDRVTVSRLMLAMTSIAFALYMVPGLWGAPCKAVSAFAPPLYTMDFKLGEQELTTYHDYDEGMAAARRLGKPVLVDFSGFGCVNCRKMEAAVWTAPEVKRLMQEEYVLIELMVDDKTPLPSPISVVDNDQNITLRTVGDRWSYLQRHKFGTNAQPFYVLLDAEGRPLTGSYSYDENVEAYVQFLNRGLSSWKK